VLRPLSAICRMGARMAQTTPEQLVVPHASSETDAASHFLLEGDVAPESLSRLLRHARSASEQERQVVLAFLGELAAKSLRAVGAPSSRSSRRLFSSLTELSDGRSGVVSAELVSDGHGRSNVIRLLFEEKEGISTDIHLLTIPPASNSTSPT